MLRTKLYVSFCLLLICSVVSLSAQQAAPAAANAVVPPLIKFSGVLTDVNNKPLTGTVGVTFSLYKDSQGGAALWVETQNLTPDKAGHYSVMLGSTTSQGVSSDVFASGEARWLGVQAQGQAEQPRTVLISVPYALKALDAETVGGKPASSFMLAPAAAGKSAPGKLPPGTITGSGTADYIPRFTGATTIGNSNIFETVGGNVGIATTSPGAKLDVKGTEDVRNTLTLFPSGTHPTLSVHGTAFEVSSTGLVTFVSGQAFPGTGTVTSVGLSAPNSDFTVSGSPVTTSGTLGLGWTVAPTSADTANAIVKRDANGVISVSAVEASTSIGGLVALNGFSDSGAGVVGESNKSQGVYGVGTYGVYGTSPSGYGVWGSVGSTGIDGVHAESASQYSAVAGLNSANGYGIYGLTKNGYGVWGEVDGPSGLDAVHGFTQSNGGAGVAGETSQIGNVGVYGYSPAIISDSGWSAFFDGPNHACGIRDGNLACGGSKSAVVPVDGGSRKVALYAVEAPENWFEDFGSGRLSSGAAAIRLEPTFAQTVNTDLDYHVFLTPNGDSRGLYISAKTKTSFEVREQGGGSSSISFDYRIVARRRNYENIRLADMTEGFNLKRPKPEVRPETLSPKQMYEQPRAMAYPIAGLSNAQHH